MNNPRQICPARRMVIPLLGLLAAALLLASLPLPLWQMRLEAPQYRDEEALNIAVHPNALRGDLRELKVLNQYVGVHVPPTLPQFQWLPILLAGGAALGLIASVLKQCWRTRGLAMVIGVLSAGLALAAIQAMTQMHDIGHKRDAKTILVGLKDFTPPFLGTKRIAQFEASSRFGTGAWLIGGALLLQVAAAMFSFRFNRSPNPARTPVNPRVRATTQPSGNLMRCESPS